MKVEQNLANYRTLLIELLVKIRIKAPASLHNLTIGEMFAHMDWEGRGGAINTALLSGEHNALCLAHGRRPLIPYQQFSPAPFKHLPRGDPDCQGEGGSARRPLSKPSYQDLFSVAPLRSSSIVFSLSQRGYLAVLSVILVSFRSVHFV